MTDSQLNRLPSGVITGSRLRWTDFGDGDTGRVLCYQLARLIEARIGREIAQRSRIVYWEAVPESLADALATCLGSGERPVRFEAASLSFNVGDYSPLSLGESVIVFCDSLLSGGTAESIVRTVSRMAATPRVLCAFVDGRRDLGVDVRTYAQAVPVVSCRARTVVWDGPEPGQTVVNISPSGDIEKAREAAVATRRLQGFESWVRNTTSPVLRIGHVDRGPLRHFSTYIDVDALVDRNELEVQRRYERVLRSELSEVVDTSARRIRVFAPEKNDGLAVRLAGVACAAARKVFPNCNVEIVAIGWSNRGWHVVGPALTSGFVAVIVDWGAVTTGTIRELAEVVCLAGAEFVGSFVLTCQLDDESRHHAEGVRAIEVKGQRPPPNSDQRLPFQSSTVDSIETETTWVTDVRVRFLENARMGMSVASGCHLCRVAQGLRHSADHAPTSFLREHARETLELFRPVSRHELLALPAADLVRSPMTGSEAADVWEIRQDLEACSSSTASRADVSSKLQIALEDSPAFWHALIRLLAVEAYWLKRSPLSDRSARDRIGSVCRAIVSDGPPDSRFITETRWQAAMVLRCASKREFVSSFSENVLSSIDSGQLIPAELCYGMHTLLEAPHHHSPRALPGALHALRSAMEGVGERLPDDPQLLELHWSLRTLHSQAVEIHRALPGTNRAESSWHALHGGYMNAVRTHSGVLTTMLRIVGAVSGPSADARAKPGSLADSQFWLAQRRLWDECRDFLSALVFPYLPQVSEQLEAVIPRGLAGTTFEGLSQLTRTRAARFADWLEQLAGDPSSYNEHVRQRLEGEAVAWFNQLLSSPAGDGAYPVLYRLLEGNPTEVVSAARAAELAVAEALHVEDGDRYLAPVEVDADDSVRVFCNSRVLIEILTQVLQNAVEHDDDVTTEVRCAISFDRVEGMQRIRIRNSGSARATRAGYGLLTAASSLSRFGGRITHGESSDPLWSYEVEIVLPSWSPDE